MKAATISEAARRLKVHRQTVYRLIEAGTLRRLSGSGLIPLDDIQDIPRQRASLKTGCIRKISLAGHDPRQILSRLCSAAIHGADADTLLHAGRLMLEGDREFLDTLEAPAPPIVQCADLPDRSRPPRIGFPAFIAGRVRSFSKPLRKNLPLPKLWQGFWLAVTRSKLDIFPMFSGGWMRMAPDWQHDAAFFCRLDDSIPSFGSPAYRPTSDETKAAVYMEEHFRDALSADQFDRDGVPAVLSIIRAWNHAAQGDILAARLKLAALDIPPETASGLVRLSRRACGRFRLIKKETLGDVEMELSPRDIYEATYAAADHMDGVEAYTADFSSKQRPTRASIIQALGISMVTLRRWTAGGL